MTTKNLMAACSLTLGALALAVAALPAQAQAHNHDAHAHHHATAAPVVTKRTEVSYMVPAQAMVRADGKKASFPAEIDDGKPVILQFVYTSCTAICPVTSQTFAQLQDKLGKQASGVRMVSISIDPDYDTPQRLAEYAKKLGAGPQWQFYTGTLQSSVALQKAFDAYRGDKMNHTAVTFMRAAPGKPWVRLDGLSSPDDLFKEFQKLAAKS